MRRAPALQCHMAFPTPPPLHPEETSGKLEKLPEGAPASPKKPETSPNHPGFRPLLLQAVSRPLGPTALLIGSDRSALGTCWAPRGPHDCGASGHPSAQLRLEFGPLR